MLLCGNRSVVCFKFFSRRNFDATGLLLQVTILNESHFPDWNISEFRMMRGDTVRSIKHFHFTTWPDFGEYRNQFRLTFPAMLRGGNGTNLLSASQVFPSRRKLWFASCGRTASASLPTCGRSSSTAPPASDAPAPSSASTRSCSR